MQKIYFMSLSLITLQVALDCYFISIIYIYLYQLLFIYHIGWYLVLIYIKIKAKKLLWNKSSAQNCLTMNLLVVSILSIRFFSVKSVPHQTLEYNDSPKFEVTASRSTEEPPTISISFSNGVQDNLVLSPFKLRKQSNGRM